ncbi:DUF3667 domain-containing protein [Cyclobacterium jeungdonense]|uniref:DUF3667 domain-containing protein n=1 Tax=Cyclobacterium jeungdonense TaxID=708087 RepID=A0ABT8CCV1_9BACT|nr:DUF3667 domain-containing protein [Cyclobacterium jeungdonense]MDN3689907.1 DUF3667 domain-containing protein [Cyclobacterium jeungdonense]
MPELENFCPNCGQENKDQKVPVGVFIEELLTSLFSFDGRFLQTLTAFFFKPGKLTQSFNEGQRKKYTHPIRLYLVFSLFYFFMMGFLIPKDFFDRILNAGQPTNMATYQEIIDKESGEPVPVDSAAIKKALRKVDEIQSENFSNVSPANRGTNTPNHSWKALRFLSIDPEISAEEFGRALDSSSYAFDIGLPVQKKRDLVAHSNLFLIQVAKNLPLMMLFLLPVFAFFIHLLYANRSVFYIENLILGFHLHAFAYAIYGIVILLTFFGGIQSSWLILGAFVLVTTYAYLSFLKIYRHHWFKTLIKFWILGGLYLAVLLSGMAAELYLSLLLL